MISWVDKFLVRKIFRPVMSSAKCSEEVKTEDQCASRATAAGVNPALIEEWNQRQKNLRKEIVPNDTEEWQRCENLSGLNRVAGVDISVHARDCDAKECDAFAAVVICKFPTMEVIHEETQKIHLTVPYVPGYLAFRESSAAIDLLKRIATNHPDKVPDVLLVDGNGILHPHRCGLACHIGIQTSIPSIGVAKNLHLIEGASITDRKELQSMSAKGDYILIRDESNNEAIGMALKTAKDTKNPMYISIGHKINLDTAKRVVLQCCKYRQPEPIRFADNISRELIRETEKKSQSEKH